MTLPRSATHTRGGHSLAQKTSPRTSPQSAPRTVTQRELRQNSLITIHATPRKPRSQVEGHAFSTDHIDTTVTQAVSTVKGNNIVQMLVRNTCSRIFQVVKSSTTVGVLTAVSALASDMRKLSPHLDELVGKSNVRRCCKPEHQSQ